MIENFFMKETLSKVIVGRREERERERERSQLCDYTASQAQGVDEVSDGAVISSLPDDAFFILQKSLR